MTSEIVVHTHYTGNGTIEEQLCITRRVNMNEITRLLYIAVILHTSEVGPIQSEICNTLIHNLVEKQQKNLGIRCPFKNLCCRTISRGVDHHGYPCMCIRQKAKEHTFTAQ